MLGTAMAMTIKPVKHKEISMGKILAVASAGGHWKQMMKLASAFPCESTIYVTTGKGLAEQNNINNHYLLIDANRDKPWQVLILFWKVSKLIIKQRPSHIVSTGAAPGLMCILLGRLIGAKTLWIDSIANGEKLSMCGNLSKKIAHKTLSQWQHLSDKNVEFHGAVV